MELELPQSITFEEVISLWPFLLLWSAALTSGLVLIFGGRPTWRRRAFGVAMLALIPLMAFSLWAWASNGCIEGYADSTRCDVASSWFLFALILAGGAVATLFWGLGLPARRPEESSGQS